MRVFFNLKRSPFLHFSSLVENLETEKPILTFLEGKDQLGRLLKGQGSWEDILEMRRWRSVKSCGSGVGSSHSELDLLKGVWHL